MDRLDLLPRQLSDLPSYLGLLHVRRKGPRGNVFPRQQALGVLSQPLVPWPVPVIEFSVPSWYLPVAVLASFRPGVEVKDRVEVSLELIQELGVSMLRHDRLVDPVEVRDLLKDAPGQRRSFMVHHYLIRRDQNLGVELLAEFRLFAPQRQLYVRLRRRHSNEHLAQLLLLLRLLQHPWRSSATAGDLEQHLCCSARGIFDWCPVLVEHGQPGDVLPAKGNLPGIEPETSEL
mmetsp:Transcript_14510/g.49564  ORF Transcript_14510/g.49564 Transcript_14510/m.49564 type:complete len:232 (+) Transcript_14510:340-1035(+)